MKNIVKLTKCVALMMTATVFLLSCGSNGDPKGCTNNKAMQYTVSVANGYIGAEMISGKLETGATIDVFECAENGDKIYQNKVVIKAGTSQTYTAQPLVKKIKVHVSTIDVFGTTDLMYPKRWDGWLSLNYYLSPDKSTVIEIDNNTELHRTEP